MINDDTGVCLTESPDIQYNLSGKSGKLLLNRYCRKTALTFYARNMGFLHNFDEVGDGSDTLQLEFNYVLRTSHWFQVKTSH